MRVGVIGDPVAHSISPAMQQPALDAMGIAAIYQAWHTTAAELPGRIQSLRDPGVLGANVTVPHKQAVIPLLDEITPAAGRAGAVNTIVPTGVGLVGHNTDIAGFARSLQMAGADLDRASALVLGAGGAARGVVLALEQLGFTRIAIANRNPDKAQQLADDLHGLSLEVLPLEGPRLESALGEASLLVNATALGWRRGEFPIPLELLARLRSGALVADLTYRDTDLLEAARALGLQTLDGLPMLVYQGAEALALWTGRPAPVEIMMEAAIAARASRA
jgi:shikimate dehydrogenase